MAAITQSLNHSGQRNDQPRSNDCPSPTSDDWNRCRSDIKLLYCEQGWPLSEVMKAVEDKHGFKATKKQFKDKINQWQLGKNLHEDDIVPLILLLRRAAGDACRPRVMIRGSFAKLPQLAAYLKRKGKSENEILANADVNQPIPPYMRLVYTNLEIPSTENNHWNQQSHTSPAALATPSWTTTYSDPFSGQATRLPTPESFHGTASERRMSLNLSSKQDLTTFNLQDSTSRSSICHITEAGSALRSQSDPSPGPVDLPQGVEASNVWSHLDSVESFKIVIDEILRPDSPAGSALNEANVFKILTGSQRVSNPEKLIRGLNRHIGVPNNGPNNADGLSDGSDLSQTFLAHFFGGCVLYNQKSPEAAAPSFQNANNLLELMISNFHPECLTALSAMLSVLESHGRNHLAGAFLSNVLILSCRNLAHNPIAKTAEFMVTAATRKLRHTDIADLQIIYDSLKDMFGVTSSSALVGLYNLAWRCAKVEEHRERALEILTGLIPAAASTLGPSHFLTIYCMTTAARVLSYVRTMEESVFMMRQALSKLDSRYAVFHPYRLEVLHRLACILIEMDKVDEAKCILKEVVERRTNVLGAKNPLTERSVKYLQEVSAKTGNGFKGNRNHI